MTVKLDVPVGPVGVPVMCPDESILNPLARLPVLTVSVTAPAPPEVATVWLYAVPCVAAGREVVVTVRGGVTVMAIDADFVESAADVAVTVAVPALPEVGAL
jgi:hypothetical protein